VGGCCALNGWLDDGALLAGGRFVGAVGRQAARRAASPPDSSAAAPPSVLVINAICVLPAAGSPREDQWEIDPGEELKHECGGGGGWSTGRSGDADDAIVQSSSDGGWGCGGHVRTPGGLRGGVLPLPGLPQLGRCCPGGSAPPPPPPLSPPPRGRACGAQLACHSACQYTRAQRQRPCCPSSSGYGPGFDAYDEAEYEGQAGEAPSSCCNAAVPHPTCPTMSGAETPDTHAAVHSSTEHQHTSAGKQAGTLRRCHL